MAGLRSSVALSQALTWQQIKEKFAATNPTLKAAQLNMDESRAAEFTACLRPNPDIGFSTDGTQLSRYQGVYPPFAGTQFGPNFSYLHERQQMRELRRDQAKESTAIAEINISRTGAQPLVWKTHEKVMKSLTAAGREVVR